MGSVTLKDMIPEDTQVSVSHTGLNNGYGYKVNTRSQTLRKKEEWSPRAGSGRNWNCCIGESDFGLRC